MNNWADDEDKWRSENDPSYPGYIGPRKGQMTIGPHHIISETIRAEWVKGFINFRNDDDGSAELFLADYILKALKDTGYLIIPKHDPDMSSEYDFSKGRRGFPLDQCPTCKGLDSHKYGCTYGLRPINKS